MSDDGCTWRDLAEGEAAEPTEAWIEFADGARLDFDLERVEPLLWRARPPVPVVVSGGEWFRVDRLPAGGHVEFLDVVHGPPADHTSE